MSRRDTTPPCITGAAHLPCDSGRKWGSGVCLPPLEPQTLGPEPSPEGSPRPCRRRSARSAPTTRSPVQTHASSGRPPVTTAGVTRFREATPTKAAVRGFPRARGQHSRRPRGPGLSVCQLVQKPEVAAWTGLPLKFMPFDPDWRDGPTAHSHMRSGVSSTAGSKRASRGPWTARRSCHGAEGRGPPLQPQPVSLESSPQENPIYRRGAQ